MLDIQARSRQDEASSMGDLHGMEGDGDIAAAVCFFEHRTAFETSVMRHGVVAWKGETITLFSMLQVMHEWLVYQEI